MAPRPPGSGDDGGAPGSAAGARARGDRRIVARPLSELLGDVPTNVGVPEGVADPDDDPRLAAASQLGVEGVPAGASPSTEEDTERRPLVAAAPRRKRTTQQGPAPTLAAAVEDRSGAGLRTRPAAPPPPTRAGSPNAPTLAAPSAPPPRAHAPTVSAGRAPTAPGASRIAVQLARVLRRKRESIRLELVQAAGLAGIDPADLADYETTGLVPYDRALVLARVLGLAPSELPGMRATSDSPLRGALATLTDGLRDLLRLVYRNAGEESLSGPVDALAGVGEFVVEVGDASLPELPRGTLLAFQRPRRRPGDRSAPVAAGMVVALHRPSGVLALRRVYDELLVGVAPDAPSYHFDRGQWEIVGRLVLALHPAEA